MAWLVQGALPEEFKMKSSELKLISRVHKAIHKNIRKLW